MDDFFADEEKLYRAVIPKDMFIKADGSVTSAAFKVSNGCSVDRGNYRTDEEAAAFMKRSLQGSIYSLTVKICREKDVFVKYEPEENNPYHSGLYKNDELEKMTPSQCRHLASSVQLVMS